MPKRRILAVVLLLLCTLTCTLPPSPSFADGNADEAELQFQLGIEAYQSQNYRLALEHFLASNRLVPNRNVIFNIADMYERLGKFPESYRYYVDALEGSKPERQTLIRTALDRLSQNVSILQVTTDPSGATIFVNRKDLGSVGVSPRDLALTPGKYKLIIELPGYESIETDPLDLVLASRTPLSIPLKRIVGQVSVTGEPDAEVRLDTDTGPPLCTIPCTFDAPPGRHTLFLSKPGRTNVQRPISVEANQKTEASAQLRALTGSLLVRTEEREALVEVDGEPRGFTPAVISDVPVGPRKVRVSLYGYKPTEFDVDIQQGQQTLLDQVRLVPLREVAAASRELESIEDAPASITILDTEELRAFQYPTIYEALRGVRGFALTFDSIYGNASVRGLGQPNDYNNKMLLLSDGATLNENILSQAFISYDGRVDLEDVERIEIIRGPGSVIYGTGAVSGVVNMVPHRREEASHVRVSVGTADQGVAKVRAGFKRLIGEASGVEVSVSAARSDGWNGLLKFDADGDGIEDQSSANGINRFDAISTTGRAWVGDVTAQWLYSARNIEIPTGSFGSKFNDLRNNYTDQRGMFEVRYEPKLTDSLSMLVRAHVDMYLFDLGYINEVEIEDPPGTPAIFEQPYTEDYLGLWGGLEARITWRPFDGLRVALGAEAVVSPVAQLGISQDESTGASTTILDKNSPYQTYAGYLLTDWKFARWARLSAGVRLDAWDRRAADGEDFLSTNPRIALILQPSLAHNVKIMAGRAFRAPSVYEFFYTDEGISTQSSNCCGKTLKPETFYQSEVEYTYRWDDDWSLLGSVHALYAQDSINSLPVPNPDNNPDLEEITFFGNSAEDQLMLGADIELRRELRNGWMFSAQGGYLSARYLSTPAESATDNATLPNAPLLYGSIKGIVPILAERLKIASRLTLEAPRRIDLSGDEDTQWVVVGDLVLSGQSIEFNFDYALGLYNMFDWQYAMPAAPFASRSMPQQGRSVLAHIGVTF